jgi:predicted phosphoribosyltransferase
MLFRDRRTAGRLLSRRLVEYAREDAVVLGVPRGGVPVGYEVAAFLRVPLDVLVVRRLGVPGREEVTMGSVASGGVVLRNDAVIREVAVPPGVFEDVLAREHRELVRREAVYRNGRPPLPVAGRTVLLTDDGIATAAAVRTAVQILRRLEPRAVVVAVPVAVDRIADELRRIADRVVCLVTPPPFRAIGAWYDDFSYTTDREVRDLIDRSARERLSTSSFAARSEGR